jgi:hypothetical protein
MKTQLTSMIIFFFLFIINSIVFAVDENVQISSDWIFFPATETHTHDLIEGDKRLLIFIGAASRTSPLLESVTYGGQSMVKIIDQLQGAGSTKSYIVAYYLDEDGITKATGNTFVPVWSGSGNTPRQVSVLLENINQIAPIKDYASIGATTTNEPVSLSRSLLTSDGGLAIAAAVSAGKNTHEFSIDNGFTRTYISNSTVFTNVTGFKSTDGSDLGVQVTNNIDAANRIALLGFTVDKFVSGGTTGSENVFSPAIFNIVKKHNTIEVSFDSEYQRVYRLSMYNMLGGQVYSDVISNATGRRNHIFDTEKYSSGVYIVSISDGINRVVKKVVM